MITKFNARAHLDDADRAALLALPYRLKVCEASKYVVREGSAASHSALILSGFAMRHKTTADGDRQIVSIHVPGDFIDLQGSLLATADHNVQTLSRCELALVPVQSIRQLVLTHPRVAYAMWVDTLVDGSIHREWVLNVGRRDARARLAHLLCEFARRLEVAGLGRSDGYELPMSQEQLADATGMTTVHVNRTLRSLELDRLVLRRKRFVGIPDWERLRDVAGFNEIYLHLDQAGDPASHYEEQV